MQTDRYIKDRGPKQGLHLDHKGILKDNSPEAGYVGREGLSRQVCPRMDVQVNLHVVCPKVESVLRAGEHWLVIVIAKQLVLSCGQWGILRPLLHICNPGDQLQAVPCRLPAPEGRTFSLKTPAFI